MYEWPFAIARKALAVVDEPNLTPYDYAYALPTDNLRLLDLLDDQSFNRIQTAGYRLGGYYPDSNIYYINRMVSNTRDPFYVIEGTRLYTDLTPCYAKYIRRLETVSQFPELFASALIFSLAAKVTPRLSQNFGLAQTMAGAAAAATTRAISTLIPASRPRPTRNNLWSEYN
jgi:hypothetical protein